MFKEEIAELEKYEITENKPFVWLEGKEPYDLNMGTECSDRIESDLIKLKNSCKALRLKLPEVFVEFMRSPDLWRRFRSVNSGFFDIRYQQAKCPQGDGFLVPFISDQQYCHFYFLHLTPMQPEYQIVWADDIYLCDNSFEHFMRCHYENNERWFRENAHK